jgi:Flp pilus assembly protein TadD
MPETLTIPVTQPAPTTTPRRNKRRRWLQVLYWPAVVSLIALNAWWWWDSRPIPNLRVIDLWLAVPKENGTRIVPWWEVGDVSRDNPGAIAVLRRAVRKSPNDAEARSMLGRALGAAGDLYGCIEQLRLVPSWSPQKLPALYGEGMALLELKRAREAEAAFLAYIAPDPNHPRPRPERVTVENKLWDIYAWEDRWEEARKIAWQAYKDADGRPDIQRKILEVILRTRIERSHPAAAVENLRPIVEADPQDWQARRALARALDGIKEYDEADRQLARCLKERPKDPKAWVDKLEMLEGREDFEGLKEAEKQAPPEADSEGRIWIIRGHLKREVRDFAGAAEAFQKALDRMPDDLAAQHKLAQALQMTGKTEEAAVHRRRHAELEPMTKEVPQRVNTYRDVTDLPNPDPATLKDAILKLAAACKGMGWNQEAEAWIKTTAGL